MQAILTGNLDEPADSNGAHGGIDVEGGVQVPTMILHVAGIRTCAVLCCEQSTAATDTPSVHFIRVLTAWNIHPLCQ